mmetsp:Transcript_12910/g.58260  ORF Transcript_12910/g.58260 Transcript_12910/m.58260 type:complete len:279 (+) Transcript_12910:1184-2020(+)
MARSRQGGQRIRRRQDRGHDLPRGRLRQQDRLPRLPAGRTRRRRGRQRRGDRRVHADPADGHVPPRPRHVPLLRRVRAHRGWQVHVHRALQRAGRKVRDGWEAADDGHSRVHGQRGNLGGVRRRSGQGQDRGAVVVSGGALRPRRERRGPRRLHRAAGQALPPGAPASGRGPHHRRGEARSFREGIRAGKSRERTLRRRTRRVHRQLQRHRVGPKLPRGPALRRADQDGAGLPRHGRHRRRRVDRRVHRHRRIHRRRQGSRRRGIANVGDCSRARRFR